MPASIFLQHCPSASADLPLKTRPSAWKVEPRSESAAARSLPLPARPDPNIVSGTINRALWPPVSIQVPARYRPGSSRVQIGAREAEAWCPAATSTMCCRAFAA